MSEPNEELKGNEPKREKVRIIPVELIDDFSRSRVCTQIGGQYP